MPGRVCVALVALAFLGPAGSARADDGESALGVALAYGGMTVTDHEPEGGGLVLDYRRGITEVVWLRVALAGAALRSLDETSALGQGVVGITYALDILEYVPYVDLGVGASVIGGGALATEVHPAIELGLGLDVLTSRSLGYGPFVRMAAYLDESALVTVGVRAAYRWGFF